MCVRVCVFKLCLQSMDFRCVCILLISVIEVFCLCVCYCWNLDVFVSGRLVVMKRLDFACPSLMVLLGSLFRSCV